VRRFTPVVVQLCLLATASFMTGISAAEGLPVNSSLRFLQARRGGPLRAAADDRALLGVLEGTAVTLTVKFDHALSTAEIADLEARGCSFFRIDGEVARTRTIYPLNAPWDEVETLGARRDVLRIEARWKPAVLKMTASRCCVSISPMPFQVR